MAASSAVHLEPSRAASHKWLIALAVMLGTTLEVLDSSIINVALPELQGAFSASLDESFEEKSDLSDGCSCNGECTDRCRMVRRRERVRTIGGSLQTWREIDGHAIGVASLQPRTPMMLRPSEPKRSLFSARINR
jgi:hypothetical protein